MSVASRRGIDDDTGIDPVETDAAAVVAYIAVGDIGVSINYIFAAGQLLVGRFMDYSMLRAGLVVGVGMVDCLWRAPATSSGRGRE